MGKIGGNALVIREINMNLVRHALKEQVQATKRQIADSTGLSIVTVGTVLQYLLQRDEVREAGMISSSGGRPAQQYIYNDEHTLSMVLFPYEEQGKIFIRSTVVTLSGRRLYESSSMVQQVDLPNLEKVIEELLRDYPAIGAIGFGLPGAEIDGRLVVSDYEALRDVAVAEYFKDRYQMPVIIENDVNAAVIGYCRRTQVMSGNPSVVYLYFPDRFPPGAGIFINGKLYKGKRGFAGEVANIPLGISWGAMELLSSTSRFIEAVGKLTVAVSSVLNPDTVVLYGSFLSEDHLQSIADYCLDLLPEHAVPRLLLSDDFAADYLHGMIVQTLQTLEPDLQLTKSEA